LKANGLPYVILLKLFNVLHDAHDKLAQVFPQEELALH
jgi:hypothetical protein